MVMPLMTQCGLLISTELWPDWGDAAAFGKGLVQSAVGTVTDVYNVVRHPINTAKALASLGTPEGAVNMTMAAVGTVHKFKSGDYKVKANMIGNVVGDVAQLGLGTGEVKVATESVKVAKIAGDIEKVPGVANDVNEVGKGANTLEVGSHTGESIVARIKEETSQRLKELK